MSPWGKRYALNHGSRGKKSPPWEEKGSSSRKEKGGRQVGDPLSIGAWKKGHPNEGRDGRREKLNSSHPRKKWGAIFSRKL